MKSGTWAFLLGGIALYVGASFAGSGELVEPVGDGEINWSQGIITAKGSGAPPVEAKNIAQARLMAERAALADARRNLLEVVKGVRVDSETTVENFMVKGDQIRLQVEGFIQGAAELKNRRRYLSDGAIETTVAMSLSGDFLTFLLATSQTRAEVKPAMKEPLSPPKPILPPEKKIDLPPPLPRVTTEEEKPIPVKRPETALTDLPRFTGLVIDARGLNLRAALIPQILDERGQELYQADYVGAEKSASQGLALYFRDLTAAQTHPRVGKNPLTVKGAKVPSDRPSAVMLNAEGTKRVAPFARKGTFLEQCKVTMVLD